MLLARYMADALDPFDDRIYTTGRVIQLAGDTSAGEVESSYKVSTVWRAVNVLAAAVAVLPIDIFRRLEPRGKDRARDVPIRKLLRLKPNRMQTSYRWRHHLMGHVILGGNYYAQKIMAGTKVQQLWPLDARRMRVDNVRFDGTIDYVYTTRRGRTLHLTQDQVLHVRGFSQDGIVGVSVFDVMRDLVSQALTAQRQRTTFLRNELRPSATISHPKHLEPAGRESLEGSLQRAFGGPTKAGRIVVLDEAMKIEPFSISSRDAQFVESEHFRVEEFLRFIGVPSQLVGHSDKTAAYASDVAFFQAFKDHNVFPWTRNLEQELTASLLGDDQDELFVEFNLDAMLRPDSKARAEFYRALVELGVLTRNEVRELENRNPLPGLDEPLTPLNMAKTIARIVRREIKALVAPPARALLPAASQASSAHLEAIAREAAANLVRKEVLTFQTGRGRKNAARYAKEPAAWEKFVSKFYADHARLIVERLQVSPEAAARYCREQQDELLEIGVAACDGWEPARVDALLELVEETARDGGNHADEL